MNPALLVAAAAPALQLRAGTLANADDHATVTMLVIAALFVIILGRAISSIISIFKAKPPSG
jgi:hypothetical protein